MTDTKERWIEAGTMLFMVPDGVPSEKNGKIFKFFKFFENVIFLIFNLFFIKNMILWLVWLLVSRVVQDSLLVI